MSAKYCESPIENPDPTSTAPRERDVAQASMTPKGGPAYGLSQLFRACTTRCMLPT